MERIVIAIPKGKEPLIPYSITSRHVVPCSRDTHAQPIQHCEHKRPHAQPIQYCESNYVYQTIDNKIYFISLNWQTCKTCRVINEKWVISDVSKVREHPTDTQFLQHATTTSEQFTIAFPQRAWQLIINKALIMVNKS